MTKIKRFIDCSVPVTTCNLRCPYCYITQSGGWKAKLPEFKYNAEYIGKALSQERLGGACHLNMCGGGETLLPPEMTDILRVLLENGHYIMVVTNGTVSQRFDEIIKFPSELLKRLGFKFSFHYTELLRTNKLNIFCDNVNKARKAGCSISIELTPYDELESEILNIKDFCKKNFGALCHVTVGRINTDPKLRILTQESKENYRKTWEVFDSDMFNFKLSTFYVKRREFCYAGSWSGLLDLGTGELTPCYRAKYSQNIFKDLKKPISWVPIGKHCHEAHCYNSHAFLTLGVVPELATPTYAEMRNRICDDGEEWLTPEMKSFLSQKLYSENCEYTTSQKLMLPLSKFKLGIHYYIHSLKKHYKNSISRKI